MEEYEEERELQEEGYDYEDDGYDESWDDCLDRYDFIVNVIEV